MMLQVVILLILILFIGINLILCLGNGILLIIHQFRHLSVANDLLRFKRCGILLVIGIIISSLLIWLTQLTARTPVIRDEKGNQIEGSIAQLRQVTLNGHKEWISIRGEDSTKPVLLFLAGGPGGSQMAAVRYDLSLLEKEFVVVNWDQPGSGKSYKSVPLNKLTPDTYVEDGYALTQYLCKEFKKEKIFLVGESWGSALGILLSEKYPEYYHAFIGTGQMVAFLETEYIDYELAMNIAKDRGDYDLVAKLEKNGPPPYYGSNVTWKSAEYLNYLSGIMATNPQISNGGFSTIRDLAASEYGLLDKAYYIIGIINTFNHVYPQLYEMDLRVGYTELDIPVYFLLGRHDINAPLSLSQDYFDMLKAPRKRLIWFERSGHNPWINESEKFAKTVIDIANENISK